MLAQRSKRSEEKRKPEACFRDTARAPLVQIRPLHPTMRTEKDIGSENPETTTVSGFFRAFFQGGIQKISFPKNDLWGDLNEN